MTANRTLVIAHGKSEIIMVKAIGSALRVPVEVYALERGEQTITMAALPQLLSQGSFKSESALHRVYPRLDYHAGKQPKMPELRIFPIMDVDGAVNLKKSYLSGDMFRSSPFCDRIVPICNDDNLDEIIGRMGLGDVRAKKVTTYHDIFDTLEADAMPAFLERLEHCEGTNLGEFVQCCMRMAPSFQYMFPNGG